MRHSRRHSRKNRRNLKKLATMCLVFALVGLTYAITLPSTSNKHHITDATLSGKVVLAHRDPGNAANIKNTKAEKTRSTLNGTTHNRAAGLTGRLLGSSNTPENDDYTHLDNKGDIPSNPGNSRAAGGNTDSNDKIAKHHSTLPSGPTNSSGGMLSAPGNGTPHNNRAPAEKMAKNGSMPSHGPTNDGNSTPSAPGNGAPGNTPAPAEKTAKNSGAPSYNPANNGTGTPSAPGNGAPSGNQAPAEEMAKNSSTPSHNPTNDSNSTPSAPGNGAPSGNQAPAEEIAKNSGTPSHSPANDDGNTPLIPTQGIPGDTPWDKALNEPVIIDGTGPISGPVIADTGTTVSPGHSPGTLDINGDFILEAGGLLKIEFAGTDPGLFDILDISGNAIFEAGGIIEFNFINNYVPLIDDSFEFLLANSITGFNWDDPNWLTLSIAGLPTDLGFTIDHTQAKDGRASLTFKVISAARQSTTVPEPATTLLLCLGLIGIAYQQKRLI